MFRLLTYNIQRGGRHRVDAIAAVISACAPDLVLLQEATDPSNVERLAAATGMGEWRSFRRQSLGFLSRRPVARYAWVRPRLSRHAFIEVVPAGTSIRLFGVHLSAIHAAWTERRRVMELRALCDRSRSIRTAFTSSGATSTRLLPASRSISGVCRCD